MIWKLHRATRIPHMKKITLSFSILLTIVFRPRFD